MSAVPPPRLLSLRSNPHHAHALIENLDSICHHRASYIPVISSHTLTPPPFYYYYSPSPTPCFSLCLRPRVPNHSSLLDSFFRFLPQRLFHFTPPSPLKLPTTTTTTTTTLFFFLGSLFLTFSSHAGISHIHHHEATTMALRY